MGFDHLMVWVVTMATLVVGIMIGIGISDIFR